MTTELTAAQMEIELKEGEKIKTMAELEQELMSKAWTGVPMGGVTLVPLHDVMAILNKFVGDDHE